MSILVQAWTLAVRVDALEARFPGGVDGFKAAIPNIDTFYRDDHLASPGCFLAPNDLLSLMSQLEEGSELKGYENGTWQDMAALHQIDGISEETRCDWLSFAHHPNGYSYCRLAGTDPGDLAAWPGWEPKQSQSLPSYLPDELAERFEPVILFSETPEQALAMGGIQAVVEKATGKLFYTSLGAFGNSSQDATGEGDSHLNPEDA